jgi:hypothetical protein
VVILPGTRTMDEQLRSSEEFACRTVRYPN